MKRGIVLIALALSLAFLTAGCTTYTTGEYCKKLDSYDLKLSLDRDESTLSVQFPESYCVVRWQSSGNEYAALLPCDERKNCTITASLRRQGSLSSTMWGADAPAQDSEPDVLFSIDTSPTSMVRLKGAEVLPIDSDSEADRNAWLDLVWRLKSDNRLVLDDHAEYECRDNGTCVVTGDLPLEIADSPDKTELKYTIKCAFVGAYAPVETGSDGKNAADTISAGLWFPKGKWVEIDRVPTIQHKDSIRVQYSKRNPQPIFSVLVLGIDKEDAHFEIKNGGEYLHGSLTDSFWEKIRE